MRLLYVTNIPTPYRIARFNLLSGKLFEKGVELEVLFMDKTEPDRSWQINYDSIRFKYKIYAGLHPTMRGMFAHFNPGLLFRLLKSDYQAVVIGGMGSPSHMLAPFFAGKRPVKIMSVESNLESTKITSGIGAFVKRFLFRYCDAYQVTGRRQIDLIKFFFPAADGRPLLTLPNLINEDVFLPTSEQTVSTREEIRAALSLSENERLWVLPARLSGEKGILEFLNALDGKSGFHLAILGVGPLEEQIKAFIYQTNLPVTLVGFVQEKEMARYYAAADVFVLPSLRDASPLSPIEAIRTGLPLLVSARLGNADDVCDSENGIQFDPVDQVSIESAVNAMLSKTDEQLNEMRSASLRRYGDIFDASMNIERYSRKVIEVIAGVAGAGSALVR